MERICFATNVANLRPRLLQAPTGSTTYQPTILFSTTTHQTHTCFWYGVIAAQRRTRRKTEFLLHTWQSEEFTCTCADLLCLL